jgi:hypothetical protein
MTINNREIIVVRYTTEGNWIKNIPLSNWLCILVDNNRRRTYLDEAIAKIINNDVCYVCSVGQSCEKTHDLIDEEIVFREVDIEKRHLPNHLIITTWHKDFDEGFWFAIFAAHHDEVVIEKIVVLDMTDGNEAIRFDKLLTNLKENGQKNGI